MSCPLWSEALAWRFESRAEEPADWPALVAHLETCQECRRAAIAVDPSLALVRARRLEPQAGELAEIAASTRSWIELRDLEARRASRHPAPRVSRVAAGLVLWISAALFFAPSGPREPGDVPRSSGVVAAPPAAEGAEQARVENLDRPEARIYQWGSDELDIVMVVDESLDV